jgi:hypothetical protein
MVSNIKAEALGRVLILARELDSVRGDHFKLQKILGKNLYYQKNVKWYYDVQKMSKKTIAELNKISAKIKRAIK